MEKRAFAVDSRWFSAKTQITTFKLEELLGTKLRALYQRRKGRDLYDLSLAVRRGSIDFEQVVTCFERYLDHQGIRVSRAEFEENLNKKQANRRFREDMLPLLAPGADYDLDVAMAEVMTTIIAKIPGTPWRHRSKDAP